MDLQKIKEGWQKFLKGNKANHKAAESVDDDIESDEAKDKAEEETAKAIAKENDDLSKVKMTSGSRDKTYGINKKNCESQHDFCSARRCGGIFVQVNG